MRAASAESRARRWWLRLSSYSLVLLILELASLALFAVIPSILLKPVGVADEMALWPPFILVPVLLLGYAASVRLYERRSVRELSLSRSPQEFGLGYALGAALLTTVIGILSLLGVYSIIKVNPPIVMLAPFLWMIMHAVLEELVFRGVIFRLAERSLGSIAALAISSAIFGAAHLLNPGATAYGALAICVEAGILLGAAFMLTRRLWFCFGLHAAWNFVEGSIFSSPVSGFESNGLFAAHFSGSVMLSGGSFGVEQSIVTVVLCFLVACLLFIRARRRGQIIAPFWRRPKGGQDEFLASIP